MDPSRYARAFGVQSESNKVTVTRVASNEIVYRRAVDTYRRDMTSKMTSIHREQKKLRRNMRSYRRKLREAQHLPVKKRKPFKMGWIACDSDSSFYDVKTRKDASKEGHSDSTTFPSSKLQAQVEGFLQSVDEHVHNMSLRKHEVIEEEEENNEILYDKNGRRRFLFGSGGIGLSSDALEGLEHELEGYHFYSDDHFSDSSSEVGGDHDSRTKAARKESRKQRAMELLRLNSAYFTPIDLPRQQDIETTTGESTVNVNGVDKSNPNGDGNPSAQEGGVSGPIDTTLPSIARTTATKAGGETGDKIAASLTLSKAISTVVRAVREKNEKEIASGENQNQGRSLDIRRSNKVNFGDLIKFRHGVNTKKLFSMVDQLASKHGVSSKDHEYEDGNKGFPNSANLQALHNLESTNESDSKSSLFYAMRHGNGRGARPSHSQKEEHKHGLTPEIASRVHSHNYRHTSGERAYGEPTSSLHRVDNLSTPHQHDTVDGSIINSERTSDRRSELPFLQVMSPASLNRTNNVDGSGRETSRDGRETSRDGNGATPLHPNSFRGHDESAKKRRASILDASNYVSNLRRRTMIQDHDKLFGIKNDAERFGPRRMPAALRKAPGISEHQRKADDNKITWSSALGQMKLVHTLQDLTHFI